MGIVKERFQTIYIGIAILLIIPITGACVDIYVPSLPAIQHYFSTTQRLVQTTITIYIVSYGIFQLFFGALADSWGRKKILLGGAISLAIISCIIPFTNNIHTLIFLRLLQGVAVAAIGTTCRALAPDTFKGKELQKFTNYLTIAWACGPILAPVLGGYLQHYFNWHAPIWFLAGYGIFITLLTLFMPETMPKKSALTFKTAFNNYSQILKNRQFQISILITMLVYSFLTIFNIIGPFLVQSVLNYTAVTYGHVALFMGLGWLIGNVLNRLTMNWHAKRKEAGMFIFAWLISFIMLTLAIRAPICLYNITVPTFLLTIAGGFVFSNKFATCLSLFPEIAGSTSAVLGVLFVTGAGVITALASLMKALTAVPLSATYLLIITLCLLVTLICKAK